MSEDKSFKQQRKPTNPLEGFNLDDAAGVMDKIKNLEKNYQASDPLAEKLGGNMPFGLEGNVPPEVANMFKKDGLSQINKQPEPAPARPISRPKVNNTKLDELLQALKPSTAQYEEAILPSYSKFYNNGEAPEGGIIHVRRMTGDEEEILGTPRFLKKGQAVDMIFENCVKEKISPQHWLTVDRTYLLMYLRGISLGTQYDVELTCPMCSARFESVIDLDTLRVRYCPKDFNQDSLKGELPISKFKFEYRLPTIVDEMKIGEYYDKVIKENRQDDSATFRLATLIEEIEGLDEFFALMELIKALPIVDFAYLREIVSDSLFGTETKVDQYCLACDKEFKTELPLGASFFFPRRKKASPTRA
jgi:hypothetical protein